MEFGQPSHVPRAGARGLTLQGSCQHQLLCGEPCGNPVVTALMHAGEAGYVNVCSVVKKSGASADPRLAALMFLVVESQMPCWGSNTLGTVDNGAFPQHPTIKNNSGVPIVR